MFSSFSKLQISNYLWQFSLSIFQSPPETSMFLLINIREQARKETAKRPAEATAVIRHLLGIKILASLFYLWMYNTSFIFKGDNFPTATTSSFYSYLSFFFFLWIVIKMDILVRGWRTRQDNQEKHSYDSIK